MLTTRVIPALLIDAGRLVKTTRFRDPRYVGDPCNTARIFNELEADELLILDISATRQERGPDFGLLAEIANECFMPLAYGGGVRTVDEVGRILGIGLEKVVINTAAVDRPTLIAEAAATYGSQAIIGSIDVRRGIFGGQTVRTVSGTRNTRLDPVQWACELERRGAGEILLTSIDREGTWSGYDLELIRRVAEAVDVPVIAHGGAGSLAHLEEAARAAGASALALGSMVVYQKKGMGVLVNFPERKALEACLL